MPVTETSREAYLERRANLGADHATVLSMIERLGPCHNNRILEALRQVELKKPRRERRKEKWEPNTCWPRVNELIEMKLVHNLGPYRGKWHGKKKKYLFRKAVGDTRNVGETVGSVGWIKAEPDKIEHTEPQERAIDKIKKAASDRVMAKLVEARDLPLFA